MCLEYCKTRILQNKILHVSTTSNQIRDPWNALGSRGLGISLQRGGPLRCLSRTPKCRGFLGFWKHGGDIWTSQKHFHKVPGAFWEQFYVTKNLQKAPGTFGGPGISILFSPLSLKCFFRRRPRQGSCLTLFLTEATDEKARSTEEEPFFWGGNWEVKKTLDVVFFWGWRFYFSVFFLKSRSICD